MTVLPGEPFLEGPPASRICKTVDDIRWPPLALQGQSRRKVLDCVQSCISMLESVIC